MRPLLSVSNLEKRFSIKSEGFLSKRKTVHAVNGVSFHINKGETLGLVGESGSGKSTVGRCLTRLIAPSAGEVLFDGVNVSELPHKQLRTLRRKIQIIFQDPYGSLTPRLRVSSLLMEPLSVHGIGDRHERIEAVKSILEKVGLRPEHASRFPHEFSGGQRQRISIARAMILNPDLIIADEPVSALDVSIRAQVLNLMSKLQKEFQLSFLFISHDLSVVKYMCDRIAVMYLGKLVEIASRDKIYNESKHPYTEALLSAIPVPAVIEKKERIILEGDVPNPMSPPTGCAFHPRCARKTERCLQEIPEITDLGDCHSVACHLYS